MSIWEDVPHHISSDKRKLKQCDTTALQWPISGTHVAILLPTHPDPGSEEISKNSHFPVSP